MILFYPSGTSPGPSFDIKPKNLALAPATAVIVRGLRSQPEWNGKRGLIKSFDAARGRYALLIKGRTRPLGVKFDCCMLEPLAGQARSWGEDELLPEEPEAAAFTTTAAAFSDVMPSTPVVMVRTPSSLSWHIIMTLFSAS